MRLSEILSKDISEKFEPVEEFLSNKPLKIGQQKKINIGKVIRTYYCKNCHADVTFISDEDIFCIGVSNRLISIDCVLKCPACNEVLPLWFLVESKESFEDTPYPDVRLLKVAERFSDKVCLSCAKYGDFTEFLEKAERSYRSGLGAAAIVYLRKVFEGITHQMAVTLRINYYKNNGKPRPFKDVLKEVNENQEIIPQEFTQNGYRLFEELSDIVHGNDVANDEVGIKKYSALRRLVTGILDKVKNDAEIMQAIGTLGWTEE